MATTLSYGYINPQNGDPGSVWFPALNSNISQLNDHNHDGITSAQLASTGITGASVTIPNTSWVLDVTGRYMQDVSVPPGYNMSQYSITFYLSTGEIICPSITQLSGTSFRVYGPDTTLSYVAVFR